MSFLKDWENTLNRVQDLNREKKEKRISEFREKRPNEEIFVVDEGGYTRKIGFWKRGKEIIQIIAKPSDEYDPINAVVYSKDIIDAIVKVSKGK